MPTYNFRSKTDGEIIEKSLKISELDKWKEENPDWEQIHTSAPGMVSGSMTPMRRAGKEWENKLQAIKKGSGRGNTINV